MRKLKLQMVISLDGFVKGDYGGANIKWDKEAWKFCIDNLKNVDCILLGRNTAEGFIPHWRGVADNPKDVEYKLGKPLTDIPKVVFFKKTQDQQVGQCNHCERRHCKRNKSTQKEKR